VIEQTGMASATEMASPAQRRVFRSKVDTIRPTYGFEDVSLAPGTDTIEPADVDLSQVFCGIELAIPILASAMDAVVDARMAGALARLGGLAILNLEGVQARYDEPDAVLARIAGAADDEVQGLLAEMYQQPIREELIARRLDEIHAAGSRAAVAATPGAARRFGSYALPQCVGVTVSVALGMHSCRRRTTRASSRDAASIIRSTRSRSCSEGTPFSSVTIRMSGCAVGATCAPSSQRTSSSFSPGRSPVKTMGISSCSKPDSLTMSAAISRSSTGSPMSRTNNSPPLPRPPA
jgi:hypothetical protein